MLLSVGIDHDAVDVPRRAEAHVAPRPRRHRWTCRRRRPTTSSGGCSIRRRRPTRGSDPAARPPRRPSTSGPVLELRFVQRAGAGGFPHAAVRGAPRNRWRGSPRTPRGPSRGRTSTPGRSTGSADALNSSATGTDWPSTRLAGNASPMTTADSTTKRRCFNIHSSIEQLLRRVGIIGDIIVAMLAAPETRTRNRAEIADAHKWRLDDIYPDWADVGIGAGRAGTADRRVRRRSRARSARARTSCWRRTS